jgi:hypothetical protein
MSGMVAGTLGAAALAIGTGFVIALGRAQWLSVRRLESWFAIGLIGFGLWFLWRSWHRQHPAPAELTSPSRSAALEPLPTRATSRLWRLETMHLHGDTRHVQHLEGG